MRMARSSPKVEEGRCGALHNRVIILHRLFGDAPQVIIGLSVASCGRGMQPARGLRKSAVHSVAKFRSWMRAGREEGGRSQRTQPPLGTHSGRRPRTIIVHVDFGTGDKKETSGGHGPHMTQ